jgi:hypothetical protein
MDNQEDSKRDNEEQIQVSFSQYYDRAKTIAQFIYRSTLALVSSIYGQASKVFSTTNRSRVISKLRSMYSVTLPAPILCVSCNKEVPIGAAFCPACGAEVVSFPNAVSESYQPEDTGLPEDETTRSILSNLSLPSQAKISDSLKVGVKSFKENTDGLARRLSANPAAKSLWQYLDEKLKKFIDALVRFIPTTRLILTQTRVFFREYFVAPDEAKQTNPLSPFEYLGIVILLSTLLVPLHVALLRVGGLPESVIQMDKQTVIENYERLTGQRLTVIDFTALTGVLILDEPIADAARMAVYTVLAVLFWVFSGKRIPVKGMAGYFAYTLGVSLVIDTIFLILGEICFAFLLSGGLETRFNALTLFRLPFLILLLGLQFVGPTLLFPGILPVSRRTALIATVLAFAVWGIFNYITFNMMISNSILIILPSLDA